MTDQFKNEWNAGYEKGRDDYCCNGNCNQGRDCPLRKKEMNANELADELDNMLKAVGLTDNRVPTMLRQQQLEIEALRNQLWDLKSEPWGFDRKAQE